MSSKTRDIRKIQLMVEGILIDKPATRNSDFDLYLELCHRINPVICNLPFATVINNRKDFKLPSPFSVSRARRKVQVLHPELKACEEVLDERFENWKEFREYATDEE